MDIPMKVFRMQDSHNNGPFSAAMYEASYCRDWLRDYINIDSLHPGPSDDGLRQHMAVMEEVLFACPSLHMICRWFHPLFSTMAELGFEVVEYNAPKAWLGRSMSQVVFCPKTATRVRVVPLYELLEHKERYERANK